MLVEFSSTLVFDEIANPMRIVRNSDVLARYARRVLEAFKYNISVPIWTAARYLTGRERKCACGSASQIKARLFFEFFIPCILEASLAI